MVRIVRGRSATLSHTFYVGSTATDPTGDTATVAIRRADGTALVPSGTVDNSGTGVATITLTPAETATLDTLTVTWTGTFGGQPQTFIDTVEIAGGTFFSLAEARAFGLAAATYSDSVVVDMRTTVEQAIEQACGCAFVPRYTLETLDGTGSSNLLLRPYISSIRSATVGGTAFSAGDLASLSIGLVGTVYSASRGWTSGSSNVVVGYEHGFQDVPHEIKRAALILAKTWLVGQRSPIDDRATTFSATEGGTYSLAVPGRNGSHFGVPEVDAAVDRYSLATGIA